MAAIRVRLLSTTSLGSGASALRVRMSNVQATVYQSGALRVRAVVAEGVVDRNAPANLRVRSSIVETTIDFNSPPKLRSRMAVVESLQEVLEPTMSTELFPGSSTVDPITGHSGLPGLAYEVVKKPIFNNKIVEHTSGAETATSYYQNPKWEYTLTWDYLPDRPVVTGDTALHTLMGFFLRMRGRFDTWLFLDPDDYKATAGFQKTFDGVTVDFKLVRGISGFYEPVGQLNTVPTLIVYLAVNHAANIPAAGPYTITVTNAANYTLTESVTIAGVTAPLAAGAPALGQYSVAAGVYTFNSADNGKAAVIRYRYQVPPANYTITMPNVIAFTVAPASGSTAYATFNYYFVCRFLEDVSEYTKFMDKLWNVNEIGFRSVIQ